MNKALTNFDIKLMPVSGTIAIRYNKKSGKISRFWFPQFAAIYAVMTDDGEFSEFHTIYLSNDSTVKTQVIIDSEGKDKSLPFVREKNLKKGEAEKAVAHVDFRTFCELLHNYQHSLHEESSEELLIDTLLRCKEAESIELLEMLQDNGVKLSKEARAYINEIPEEVSRIRATINSIRETA